MEFHYGLWIGVSALFTESGRQLGEENARPFALNHHIPAETIACKYPGSREGRAINVSALRTAMQNFGGALAITDAVRAFHLGRARSTSELGIWDLYIISRASIALVAYQRRYLLQQSAAPRVSDALASQYQFISGVFMICRHMMENAAPAICDNKPISAEALYSYADHHGIFISFDGMACAGSVKKIDEFLRFCIEGSGVSEPSLRLDDLVTNPSNWFDYALSCVELDCFVEAERASRSDNSEAQSAAQGIYDDVAAYTRTLSAGKLHNQRSRFEQGVVARQNAILGLLERPKIASIPTRHFAARLAA